MGKVEIMTQMKKMIEKDPKLAISEWQGTCNYVVGELVSLKTTDLNEIKIEDIAKPGEKQVVPVELFVASAVTSFGMTFHLEAHNEGVIIDKAKIIFSGTFDKAPFLGIKSGHSGVTSPMIVLSAESATNKGKVAEIAAIAIERSPVLTSLKEQVTLHIQ
ncbi:OsmC family protein [Sporosarcina sp. GW1-11]|uniref:OsmC family protein n=1 Tax=Sporosarcina sp. GW1-11 TaxID=2899126 RepID=UPI00294DE02F|nr:OsmC family protein [Sporosarcina sp. GW1-11]MDV6378167.1 OsmC family protein [Sporosarcina sp. GW1-11]